jgi:hypothetical protein
VADQREFADACEFKLNQEMVNMRMDHLCSAWTLTKTMEIGIDGVQYLLRETTRSSSGSCDEDGNASMIVEKIVKNLPGEKWSGPDIEAKVSEMCTGAEAMQPAIDATVGRAGAKSGGGKNGAWIKHDWVNELKRLTQDVRLASLTAKFSHIYEGSESSLRQKDVIWPTKLREPHITLETGKRIVEHSYGADEDNEDGGGAAADTNAAAAGDSDDVVDDDVVDADVVRRDPDPVYVDDPAVSAGVNAQRKRRLLQRARGHRSFRRERRDTATVATAAAARAAPTAAVVTRPLSVSQRWRNAWSDFGPKITSQHHRLRPAISKLWGQKRRLARRKTWAACKQRLGKLIEPPATVAVATALISAGKFEKIHDGTTVSMLLRAIKAMGRMTRRTTQPVVSPPSPAPPASPTSESETESDSPSPRTKRVLERDQHASSRTARSQRRLGGAVATVVCNGSCPVGKCWCTT